MSMKDTWLETKLGNFLEYGVQGACKVWDGVAKNFFSYVFYLPIVMVLCVVFAPFALINWLITRRRK